MSQMKVCPRCQAQVPVGAPVCLRAGCGHRFRTVFGGEDRAQMLGAQAPPPSVRSATVLQPVIVQQPMILQQPADPRRTDACSVLSVVFGGVSLLFFCFFGWAFGLAAVILGLVSLIRLRSDPYLTGRPMAVTGIALGAIPVAYGVSILLLWLHILGAAAGAAGGAEDVPPQPTPLYVPTSSAPTAPTEPAASVPRGACTFCNGTGRAPHFSHTGDGKDLSQYSVDGSVVCPVCNGTGIQPP